MFQISVKKGCAKKNQLLSGNATWGTFNETRQCWVSETEKSVQANVGNREFDEMFNTDAVPEYLVSSLGLSLIHI